MEDLKKLLAAATPGPWKIERGKRCIQGPDTRDGDPLVLTSMMGGATKWSHSPYSEYCVPGMKEGDANAALIVAAVNALPGLLAERDRLRADLKRLFRPPYCRDKMEEEGKPVYPRSCAACNDWEAKGCPLSTKGAE